MSYLTSGISGYPKMILHISGYPNAVGYSIWGDHVKCGETKQNVSIGLAAGGFFYVFDSRNAIFLKETLIL